MIDKSILNRINKLEALYPTSDLATKEIVETIIDSIESVLQYDIRSKIQLPDKDYYDIDELYKNIFSYLTVEQLRKIAYYNNKEDTI